MKPKIFISLLLAVLLVGTLAAPAFADRDSGMLVNYGSYTGTATGKYVLSTTHDGHVKCTASLSGLDTTHTYAVYVQYDPTYSAGWAMAGLSPTKRGTLRVSFTSDPAFTGIRMFKVFVEGSGEGRFLYSGETPVELTF